MDTAYQVDCDRDQDSIFDDPVAYLASLGIESELVAEPPLPCAA